MANNPSNLTPELLQEYGNLPSLAPPPGVVPDFAAPNPPAKVYHIVCSILLVVVYVCVGLRLYAKAWIRRSPGFDDGETSIVFSLGNFLADIFSGMCSRDGQIAQRYPGDRLD